MTTSNALLWAGIGMIFAAYVVMMILHWVPKTDILFKDQDHQMPVFLAPHAYLSRLGKCCLVGFWTIQVAGVVSIMAAFFVGP